jgi:hypothetical protein
MQHHVWNKLSDDQWSTQEGWWSDELHPQLSKHDVDMSRAPNAFWHPRGYILFSDGRYYLYVSTVSNFPDDSYSDHLTLHEAQQEMGEFS